MVSAPIKHTRKELSTSHLTIAFWWYKHTHTHTHSPAPIETFFSAPYLFQACFLLCAQTYIWLRAIGTLREKSCSTFVLLYSYFGLLIAWNPGALSNTYYWYMKVFFFSPLKTFWYQRWIHVSNGSYDKRKILWHLKSIKKNIIR